MADPYCTKNRIEKAASLARGERLSDLYELCEKQKTVSTARLELLLEKLAEEMRLDAIFIQKLDEKIRKLEGR